MTWEQINFLTEYFADGSKHFTLAFFAGLLGFLLTLITLFVLQYGVSILLKRVGAGYIILTCSLLVALSLALLSHWVLDYYSIWYNTPLGPPLELR